jgi:ketosteroid isomerase-like protein
MLKKTFFVTPLAVALLAVMLAKGATTVAVHAAAVRPSTSARATTLAPSTQVVTPVEREKPTPTPRPRRTSVPTPKNPVAAAPLEGAQLKAVRVVFDSLIDSIRRADADAAMKLFWNSQQLLVFNNNGTVTKSWEQSRSNRASLYEKTKDVKLDVRDVRVKALGPSAALVTCLWELSQTFNGQPEHSTGRMTLVFQKFGTEWKIIHVHTSPDRPDPSLLSPSDRAPEATTPKTEETPAKPPAKQEETPAKPPAKQEETPAKQDETPAKSAKPPANP